MISIEIGFENCTFINVPVDEVNSFTLDGITKSIYKQWHSEKLLELETAEEVVLILDKKADYLHNDPYNIIDETLFKRITDHNDITDITIKTEDGERKFYVDWNQDNDYINKYQTHAFLDYVYQGSLIIVISKTTTAEQIKKQIEEKICK